MTREGDANDTYGLALLGSLVGESQLTILKYEPEIMSSNMVPLVSVELEYHAEWCALKSPSMRGICRHHQMAHGRKVTLCARTCWGYVYDDNYQLCVSRLVRDGHYPK